MTKASTIAAIRQRRATMKAVGLLTRRRRMPRQQQPDAIRLAYFAALLKVLGRARQLVREQLEPELPHLVERATLTRADSATHLDETSSLNRIIDAITNDWYAEFPNEKLAELANLYADRTSDFQREQLAKQFKAALGIDLYRSEPWLAPKIAGFTAENVALIKSVAQRHFNDLETNLAAGLREGQRWEDLAALIEDRYGVAESSAKLVARDQIGKLFSDLNKTRQKSLGVSRYTWRGMQDNRERDEHLALEGQEFSWDDPPEEGDPGTPINCRCYGAPVFDDLLTEGDDTA